jgi:light-regulated signal transduction histidine kinase (bacteriophytochrome)
MSVKSDKVYNKTHLLLLESIGNLTAIALDKAKLHEETVQKSLEIQRRNKELDDFTYVVSHDLKEPLISIEGFSNILLLDYQEVIKSEGKEYLDSIVGASGRMKHLIDDLLMLSRVSSPSESFRDVSIKEIIEELLRDMEYTIKQKSVNVVIADNLPIVFGNETHLKVVLRNLIGNAVKFNDKSIPIVEIGFHNTENNYYLFFIKDNGIGIEKQFYEKVFVIFQRLHRREEYEGTGAGLAIAKKIIELHHGKIWLDSEPGKGTTFYFTLPKTSSTE